MQITSSLKEYEKDLLEIARLFYPKYSSTEQGVTIFHTHSLDEQSVINHTFTVTDNNGAYTFIKKEENDENLSTRKILQIGLYETLKNYTKRTFPWGSFVGIRPVKAVVDLIKNGNSTLGAINHIKKVYSVNEEKCKIIQDIIEMQTHQIKNDSLINLYINIPFCVSRCSYCSFMSSQVGSSRDIINSYVNTLLYEIEKTKELLKEKHYIVKNIYIGGGTPTALTVEELEPILKALSSYKVKEFTVEAGRADTITKDKLDLFKKYNVTRISINPQTFNDTVLKKTNRNHTVNEFLEVYKMALPYNFIINMDLIAGLSGETLKSFKEGIKTILELSPDNITIHTLSLKRASLLNQKQEDIFKTSLAEKMLNYAYKELIKEGYKPYYLYRQKNMLDNLENIGFCKNKTICEFNIDSIDEYASILALGAGGASKRVYLFDNKKEQTFNVKSIDEYIKRIDEMLQRKAELFS